MKRPNDSTQSLTPSMSPGGASNASTTCRRTYQPPKLRSCIQRQTPSQLRLMTENEARNHRHSVWSQFHSPVLENATVIDFEQVNSPDKARQVEIKKVRQSIEEMSVLLAEMQEMYNMPLQDSSQDDESSSSEAYVTAVDITSPTSSRNAMSHRPIPHKPSLGFSTLSERESDATNVERLDGPQRKLRIDTPVNRESMRASVVTSAATPNFGEINSPKRRERQSPHRHTLNSERSPQRVATDGNYSSSHRGSTSNNSQHSSTQNRHQQHHQHSRTVSQPSEVFSVSKHDLPKDKRHHHHPKGHALNHAQQTCKHPKANPSPKNRSSRSSSRKKLSEDLSGGTSETITGNDLSIENLDLPDSERKLLERFISALSKLSVEVQMDDAKRKEGRRRMNNALRALEGWI